MASGAQGHDVALQVELAGAPGAKVVRLASALDGLLAVFAPGFPDKLIQEFAVYDSHVKSSAWDGLFCNSADTLDPTLEASQEMIRCCESESSSASSLSILAIAWISGSGERFVLAEAGLTSLVAGPLANIASWLA
jgi:hypothetical protein